MRVLPCPIQPAGDHAVHLSQVHNKRPRSSSHGVLKSCAADRPPKAMAGDRQAKKRKNLGYSTLPMALPCWSKSEKLSLPVGPCRASAVLSPHFCRDPHVLSRFAYVEDSTFVRYCEVKAEVQSSKKHGARRFRSSRRPPSVGITPGVLSLLLNDTLLQSGGIFSHTLDLQRLGAVTSRIGADPRSP